MTTVQFDLIAKKTPLVASIAFLLQNIIKLFCKTYDHPLPDSLDKTGHLIT